MIKLTIPGDPQPKQRPRMTKAGHTYTPKATKEYEEYLKWLYLSTYKEQLKGYLSLDILSYNRIPKSATKQERKDMLSGKIRPLRPDFDNITKTIADGLNTIAYEDDKWIVEHSIKQFYSDTPRVEIVLRSLETG